MRKIERLLADNTPFAIIEYFESLKSTRKEKFKKYELIFINEQNELEFIVLTVKGIRFFKQHLDKIKLIIDKSYGKVYEYNEFKAYKEKTLTN